MRQINIMGDTPQCRAAWSCMLPSSSGQRWHGCAQSGPIDSDRVCDRQKGFCTFWSFLVDQGDLLGFQSVDETKNRGWIWKRAREHSEDSTPYRLGTIRAIPRNENSCNYQAISLDENPG